jgi:hypothetical protein
MQWDYRTQYNNYSFNNTQNMCPENIGSKWTEQDYLRLQVMLIVYLHEQSQIKCGKK